MPKNRGVTRSMRNPPGCRQPQGSRELAPSSTSVCTNAEKADKGADAIYIVADSVGTRVYTRIVVVKAFGRDDALMLAATVSTSRTL